MIASSEIRQRARELVEQLPGNSLFQAVAFMETLHPDRGAALEQPLLERINKRDTGYAQINQRLKTRRDLSTCGNKKKPKPSVIVSMRNCWHLWSEWNSRMQNEQRH